jgi:hypothetical protein
MTRSQEMKEARERRALWGDQRDYEVMQACRLDREALDSIRDEDGISRTVARRIHHGYMAFGS